MTAEKCAPRGCVMLAALGMAAGSIGCTTPPEQRAFSYAQFEGVDRERAYRAAEAAMNEYFRIDEADPRRGVIRSVPSETPASAEAPALGRNFGSPLQRRSIAEFRIDPRSGGVAVGCRVVLQEHDSVAQRAFSDQQGVEDAPNRTPLEENRGAGGEGSNLWGTTGNDRKLERELLAAVAERLSRPAEQPTP